LPGGRTPDEHHCHRGPDKETRQPEGGAEPAAA
jgi:hypothetical protein